MVWVHCLLTRRISHEKINRNAIAMAKCIKLKLLGLFKRNVQLTKRQYVNTTSATTTTTITINTTNSNTNITAVITITIIPKGMTVTFLRNFEGRSNFKATDSTMQATATNATMQANNVKVKLSRNI